MLDKLINDIATERNKMIDNCTLKLLTLAGCDLSPNYSNFELLLAMDDLKRKQYTISLEADYNGTVKDTIILRKCGTFEAGYEFIVQCESNEVTVITNSL